MDRFVQIAHALPGRLRLRVAALRNQREPCEAAARAVAALPWVFEVRADPFTGSFLVRYDASRGEGAAVAEALREATSAIAVIGVGERPPVTRRTGRAPPSKVGRALLQVVRDLNEEVLRRTGGGLDLGVLATASFFALGAAEVTASGKIRPAPWFNVAWYGLQTFLVAEGDLDEVSNRDGDDVVAPDLT